MMKCPKCGKDMQAGFLQAGNMIAFNKTMHKISLNPKDKDDVLIAKNLYMSTNFHGYICIECGLVIFDYKNILSRF